MNISIVSPVYLAENLIPELVSRLHGSLSELVQDDYEILLIEDGSPDKSLAYLGFGLKEELLTSLIKLQKLDIFKYSSSVFYFFYATNCCSKKKKENLENRNIKKLL